MFYALMVGAVIALRRKAPDLPRPYRTIGYPVPVLIYMGLAVLLILDFIYLKPLTSGRVTSSSWRASRCTWSGHGLSGFAGSQYHEIAQDSNGDAGRQLPGCGEHVSDWHVEWLAPPNRGPVFRGEAGIDCPCCGESILIRENSTIVGVTPPGMPTVKRSRLQAEKWTSRQMVPLPLDDYLQTPDGSQYRNYHFEP